MFQNGTTVVVVADAASVADRGRTRRFGCNGFHHGCWLLAAGDLWQWLVVPEEEHFLVGVLPSE